MEGRQLLRQGCLPTGPRCRARVRRPVAASLTAASATALMILRPTHSRVIMPAAITGRDSTARYSAMRGPTAAWRAMAQGGPHQEAMAISLRSRLLPPDDQEGNEESPRDGSAHGQAKHVAPEMKSPSAVPAALIKTTVSQ